MGTLIEKLDLARLARIEGCVRSLMCATFSERGKTIESRINEEDFEWLVASLRTAAQESEGGEQEANAACEQIDERLETAKRNLAILSANPSLCDIQTLSGRRNIAMACLSPPVPEIGS